MVPAVYGQILISQFISELVIVLQSKNLTKKYKLLFYVLCDYLEFVRCSQYSHINAYYMYVIEIDSLHNNQWFSSKTSILDKDL